MTSRTPLADEKVCPFCAETIKSAAVKCRFCQSDLPETVVSSGVAPPEVDPEPVEEPSGSWPEGPQSSRAPFLASSQLLGILVALCLGLGVVAGYAWWRSENPEDGAAPGGAITSSEARDAGMTAATQLTTTVLSYDWKTLEADTKEAKAVLAPTFRAEYAKAMGSVRAQTIKNQVKLSASVVATSIISASEHKVQALVFVNQVTTAKGSGNQRLDQNRVRVTLTRDEGDWRVSKMDAF